MLDESKLTQTQRDDLAMLRQDINKYTGLMSRNVAVNAEDGAVNQKNLYLVFRYVLKRNGADFVTLYSELLRLFAEHRKDAFHESRSLRFMDRVALDAADRVRFQNLMVLLNRTCAPGTRALAIQQLNMSKLLATFPQDEIDKIIAFYSV